MEPDTSAIDERKEGGKAALSRVGEQMDDEGFKFPPQPIDGQTRG